MNAYRTESSFFRPAFGVAAVALAALTVSLAVVAPAYLSPGHAPTQLAAKTPGAHVTEVAISPAVIDVVVLRERKAGSEALLQTKHPTRAARALPAETRLAPTSGSTMVEWRCPSTIHGRNA